MSFLPSSIRSFMKRYILAKMAPPSPASLMRFDLRLPSSLLLQSTLLREQLNQGVYIYSNVSKEGTRYINIDTRSYASLKLTSVCVNFIVPRYWLSVDDGRFRSWNKIFVFRLERSNMFVQIYIYLHRDICLKWSQLMHPRERRA